MSNKEAFLEELREKLIKACRDIEQMNQFIDDQEPVVQGILNGLSGEWITLDEAIKRIEEL